MIAILSTGIDFVVLAQQSGGRVRGIRDSFGQPPTHSGPLSDWVLIALIGAVALLLLFAWVQSRGLSVTVRNSRQLFDESLRALGLTAEEKATMKRLAREMRLSHPTSLLLSVQDFDGTANAWIERHPTRDRERLVRKLHFIRSRAFSK